MIATLSRNSDFSKVLLQWYQWFYLFLTVSKQNERSIHHSGVLKNQSCHSIPEGQNLEENFNLTVSRLEKKNRLITTVPGNPHFSKMLLQLHQWFYLFLTTSKWKERSIYHTWVLKSQSIHSILSFIHSIVFIVFIEKKLNENSRVTQALTQTQDWKLNSVVLKIY